MTEDEVSDSSDWLATPLSGLAAVEAALRCQVCKDFYKTPMMTSCAHTFCSLCIRRALASDGRCPLCRASEQELKLRANLAVDEAVESFTRARSAIMPLASRGLVVPPSPRKRAHGAQQVPSDAQSSPKRLRSSTRLSRKGPSHASLQLLDAPVDDLVSCPCCQRNMKAWQVFDHLQACPGPARIPASTFRPSHHHGQSATTTATTTTTININTYPSLSTHAKPRQKPSLERLPALNYSILKDQALRKKLSELGISSQGPRALLEKRHREWMTIWNANCDAARPKRRLDLLRDLYIWERTQGGKAPTAGKNVQTAAAIKDRDFDGAAWAAKHDSSFKHLIASARGGVGTQQQPVIDTGRGTQAQAGHDAVVSLPTMTPPIRKPSLDAVHNSSEVHQLDSSQPLVTANPEPRV